MMLEEGEEAQKSSSGSALECQESGSTVSSPSVWETPREQVFERGEKPMESVNMAILLRPRTDGST